MGCRWLDSAGRCSWRRPGETQIHNSQRCEGERRQADVPGGSAHRRYHKHLTEPLPTSNHNCALCIWVIDCVHMRRKIVIVFPPGFELPRMNYDFNGQKHRFVYGNCVADSALAKEVTFPPAFYWADETSWVHPSRLIRVICHEKPEGFEG